MSQAKYILGFLLTVVVFIPSAFGREVTSDVYRYKGYEQSTGYYEEYEVRPRQYRPFIKAPGRQRGVLKYGPSPKSAQIRTRLYDAHLGIAFYESRQCEYCHQKQSRNNRHVLRAKLTCRQCHGREPIASVEHYYSPLNLIRRHAYVCAKCHQQANISFATYKVHEPNPATLETAQSFPALSFFFWLMIGIAVLTFALFLPHTVLWGIRELFTGSKHKEEP